MPDITMCVNKNCSEYEKCYRAQAEPSMLQSYAEFLPTIMFGGDICEHFIPIENVKEGD